jgi:hypothetical protein
MEAGSPPIKVVKRALILGERRIHGFGGTPQAIPPKAIRR